MLEKLAWDKMNDLLPAIVIDAADGAVLMLGYMNREALQATRDSGQVTFYSRSKQRLWTKGETSGNTLELVDLRADCDHDALLIRARPHGPTCHRGTRSCFGDEAQSALGFLAHLEGVIDARRDADPEQSYTASLLVADASRRAQKVGEEGLEVALAAAAGDAQAIKAEAADLLYHLLVLLRADELSLADVVAELQARH